MRDIERLQHELHAKLPAFQQKVDRAKRIIRDALDKHDRWFLAFSGGVDSTVLLDLLYSRGVQYDVLTGDDGADFLDTLQFLVDTEKRYNFELQRVRCLEPWRDWCVEMGRPDLAEPGPEMDAAWLNPHQWHHTWGSLKEAAHHGYSGVFMGLLASESRARRLVLHNGNRALYQVKSEQGMWHCSPLASWTKRDIWAYIVANNVPYNPVYDKLAELDVPLERRRVAPLTCFCVMQYGSHQVLKQMDGALYNRLCALFPSVRGYS